MCELSSALTKRTTRLYIVAGSEKNIMPEVTKTEEAAQVEPVDSPDSKRGQICLREWTSKWIPNECSPREYVLTLLPKERNHAPIMFRPSTENVRLIILQPHEMLKEINVRLIILLPHASAPLTNIRPRAGNADSANQTLSGAPSTPWIILQQRENADSVDDGIAVVVKWLKALKPTTLRAESWCTVR